MNRRVFIGIVPLLILILWLGFFIGQEDENPTLENGAAYEHDNQANQANQAIVPLNDSQLTMTSTKPEKKHSDHNTKQDSTLPRINFSLRVNRNGVAIDGQVVEISVAPLYTFSVLDMQKGLPDFMPAQFDVVVSESVVVPAEVSLRVPVHGSYMLRATVLGLGGKSEWRQNTRQRDIIKNVNIHSNLRVRTTGIPTNAISSITALPQDFQAPRPILANLISENVWEFDEALLLPTKIAVKLSALSNPILVKIYKNDTLVQLGGMQPMPIRVVNAWTRNPIPTAEAVVCYRNVSVRIPCDINGVTHIPVPIDPNTRFRDFPGYTVHFVAPDYARAAVGRLETLQLGHQEIRTVELLRKGCPGGLLSRQNGEAAHGADVFLVNQYTAIASGVCDQDGRFILVPGRLGQNVCSLTDPSTTSHGLPSSPHRLVVRDTNGSFGVFAPINWDQLARGLWARALPEAKEWKATLTNAKTGVPIPDAIVERIPQEGTLPLFWLRREFPKLRSDELGQLNLGKIFGNSWRLEITADGFSSKELVLPARPGRNTPITLEPGSRLSMRLIDKERAPLAGLRIILHGGLSREQSARTNAKGQASFWVQADQEYRYTIRGTELKRDMAAPLEITANLQEYQIRLLKRSKFRLLVFDQNGNELKRGMVIYESTKSIDKKRTRELVNPMAFPVEDLRVKVIVPGFQPSGWTEVSADDLEQSAPIRLSVASGFMAYGKLESAAASQYNGKSVRLFPVRVAGFDQETRVVSMERRYFKPTTVIHNGEFHFSSVTPGTYELQIGSGDNFETKQVIEIYRDVELNDI